MNKIYIVEISGGQWEDSWNEDVVASLDRTVAEKYIQNCLQKMNAWLERGHNFDTLQEKYLKNYDMQNPIEDDLEDEDYYRLSEVREEKRKIEDARLADLLGLDLKYDERHEYSKKRYHIKEVELLT